MSLNPTMKYFNYILFLMAALPFIVRTVADDTDLADFEFDADIITERATPAERRSDLELLDDTSFEETSSTPSSAPNAFAAKEQRIRAALQRATKNGKYTQKFAQLLPILRSLNKQHKIVLASLITAQSGAPPGKEISFKQVFYIDMGSSICVGHIELIWWFVMEFRFEFQLYYIQYSIRAKLV